LGRVEVRVPKECEEEALEILGEEAGLMEDELADNEEEDGSGA
jgi:hypothetical protein